MNPTKSGTGFLTFNSLPPRLHITADTDDFDEEILAHWRSEGFDATYLPLGEGGKEYKETLRKLPNDLELGEAYAIIAYGDAAAICLDVHTKPMAHLAALVAYYPTTIAKPTADYPTSLSVCVHLAGTQDLAPRFKNYPYPNTQPGFAEHDLDEYNAIAADLAWSRTLGMVRHAFKQVVDLEPLWDEHLALEFQTKNPLATMKTMVADPYVNHIPTVTGGIGARELFRFYRDYFIPSTPPSWRMQLVSRTMGVNRIVDEMLISFRHTQEIPWMLPGVPPTNKQVEVALVSIVAMRGGKLFNEHIYWDQASVLVQIGALDPDAVPKALKNKGCKRLPVVGADAAKKVADRTSVPSNQLIPNWDESAINSKQEK